MIREYPNVISYGLLTMIIDVKFSFYIYASISDNYVDMSDHYVYMTDILGTIVVMFVW